MIRTQIQLEEAQAEALRRLSAERGESIAALIREAVDRFVSGQAPGGQAKRALRWAGAFSSGRRDISREHDAHLDEAFGR